MSLTGDFESIKTNLPITTYQSEYAPIHLNIPQLSSIIRRSGGPACPYKKGLTSIIRRSGGPACPYKKGLSSIIRRSGGPACPYKKGKLTKLIKLTHNKN